jgi:hypothetical protein
MMLILDMLILWLGQFANKTTRCLLKVEKARLFEMAGLSGRLRGHPLLPLILGLLAEKGPVSVAWAGCEAEQEQRT